MIRNRWWRRRVPAWASLAALLVGASVTTLLVRPRPSLPSITLKRITDSGLSIDPALSPDGTRVVYASDRGGAENLDIWVQTLDDGPLVRLTRHPADDQEPSFSPDGTQVIFRSERDGGGLYVVPVEGGEETRLTYQGHWPRFSPDGSKICYIGGRGTGTYGSVFIASVAGGVPAELTGIESNGAAVWSPDGRHLLFSGGPRNPASSHTEDDWWVIPSEGAEREPPVKTGAMAALARHRIRTPTHLGLDTAFTPQPYDWVGNRIIFSATLGDGTGLWEIDLSPRSLKVAGSPRRLNIGTELEAQPSLREKAGRLAFSAQVPSLDLWELPIDPNAARVTGALRPLTHDLARDQLHSVADDGQKLAFISTRNGGQDVWWVDLATGAETVLTSTSADEDSPVISRDGARVLFFTNPVSRGTSSVSLVSVKGSRVETICEDCGRPTDWSRDETHALFQEFTTPRIHWRDLRSGDDMAILRHARFDVFRAHWSPDEKWIAFHADGRQDGTRVVVAPFHGRPVAENEWIEITDGDAVDDTPRWSPDGNVLYYTSYRDGFYCVWAQRLAPKDKEPLGEPIAVQHFHSRRRSLANVNVGWLDLAIARDRLFLNATELRSNVWVADLR
jgi:eukaryotic-like serine/threonine-protein kinase